MKKLIVTAQFAVLYCLVANTAQSQVLGTRETNEVDIFKPALCNSENTVVEETVSKSHVKGWGKFINPAGDCSIKNSSNSGVLKIIVPGSENPHDLSPELRSMTGPRVLQTVEGDFKVQVKVIGDFEPGSDSTQAGRTGYNGAGLVVFADEKNFVRLERATLHGFGGNAQAYTNFEIREHGALKRMGTTVDFATSDKKPTWLRLERRGNQIYGSMSQDGVNWIQGKPITLAPDYWKNGEVEIGVAAVSTSRQDFAPVFSEFSVEAQK